MRNRNCGATPSRDRLAPGGCAARGWAMDALFGRVVFSVGQEAYRWEDVLLAAMLWGDWARLERQAQEGLACLKLLEANDEECDPDEVDAAADEFRYARDLLTAEETEAWLRRWGLTVDAWMDYIRRSILRQQRAAELPAIVAAHPVSPDEIAQAIHAEGVCSGHFARFAQKLAGRAAVHERGREQGAPVAPDQEPDLPEADAAPLVLPPAAIARVLPGLSTEVCRRRLIALARLERAFERFAAQALTPKAIRDAIQAHHLDWIQLHCRSAVFPDEAAAREAALCVREDGQALGAVARAAQAAARLVRFYLEETQPPARDLFLSARPGELVGPVPSDGAFTLFQVVRKILPSPEDPGVRRRAEGHVLERAVEREVNARVRWQSPL